ncbi:MAG: C45 family peptidase [Planctomycetota bacterium]
MPLVELPGPPGDAGVAHGEWLGAMLQEPFREVYIERVREAVGFDAAGLGARASVWAASLGSHVREEIEGMARGAGVGANDVERFLFADIASPNAWPLCSSLVSNGPGCGWIGRNCDWLTPTLLRGTAGVVHRTPHRIPVLAVGIAGDIDVDTGVNAEGLWLHLHTLHATDEVAEGRPVMSWLFWAREALETCATVDELERFIGSTARDRGVFAIAAETGADRSAVFECGRGVYARHDVEADGTLCVTNHSLGKTYPPRPKGVGNESGTIARRHAMEAKVAESGRPADWLLDWDGVSRVLAADGVEMRTPRWIRTIYSAVFDAASGRLWFAAGTPEGTPAASGRGWSEVRVPWR